MLILIEGVDGSGKSTLVDEFNILMPDDARHFARGPLKQHPLVEYLYPLLNYHPIMSVPVICDRWHVGELVYGPLYRGSSKLTPAMEAYIDAFLRSRGALKLWVDTPYETVELRLKTRGDDLLQEQHQRLVWDWYRDHLPRRGWRSVPGNLQKTKRAELVRQLLKDAQMAASMATSIHYPHYVGPPEPEVVLFGDHVTTRQDRPTFDGLPWVPYEDSPGHYAISAVVSQAKFPSWGIASPRMLLDRDWIERMKRFKKDVPILVVFGQQYVAAMRQRGLERDFRIVQMQDPARGTGSPFTVSRYGEHLLERIKRVQ
jgi:thymidylate kinase